MSEVGTRLSRRDFLKVGGAGLAGATLLGVAGCGGGGGGEGEGEGNGGGGNGGDANTLTVALDQEPAILNGLIVGGDLVATSNVWTPIQEGPLRIQPDFSFAPLLAEEMPEVVSEDPLTIEYRLREGLVWSDGEPLTSDDCLFSYEVVTNEDNQILYPDIHNNIESFETPDERTVRITFSVPDARWMDMLDDQILPRHILEGEDFNTRFNDEVIGSGPYVLEEWRKGQDLTLVRNENYWGEAPAIERIVYRFIPDTNSLKAALQAGEVQFINPPPDIGLIDELEGYNGVTTEVAFGSQWEHLAFNTEVVENPDIRRAFAHAVNRQEIVDEILGGDARPLQSILVPEQEPFYTPAWEIYEYDPDRARELVEQAEGQGASTEIEYSTTSGNALRETAQQVIQAQMEEVGITLNINNSSAESFFGDRLPSGEFEMGQWAWSSSPEPSITTLFSANNVAPDGQNSYRYRSEEATELMEESDVTIDEDERAELLQQAQEQMAEDCPLVPLFQRPEIYAFDENLSGPEVNPTVAGPFWNVGEWTLG